MSRYMIVSILFLLIVYFAADNPCQNNACVYGTCMKLNAVDYRCDCNDGYFGEFCQCKLTVDRLFIGSLTNK